MASRKYREDSYSHPPSDRRNYEDTYHHRERRSSPPSSNRRSSPHDHRRARSPYRGQSNMDRRRDFDDDRAHNYDNRQHKRSSPPREYPRYRDRDREGYRSPRRSLSRSRSRSPLRRDRSPGAKANPTREIIMEKLPVEMTESDVRHHLCILSQSLPILKSYLNIKTELENGYHVDGLLDVRVIRDRKTGASKQYGFLQFATLSLSTAFYDNNFPTIRLYGQNSESTVVSIDYSRERDDISKENADWICPTCSVSNYGRRTRCFRCQTVKTQSLLGSDPTIGKALNTGDSDASLDSTPSQFLLFRGLETSVTEEMFAKGVAKLYKTENHEESNKRTPSKVSSTTDSSHFGAQQGSLRRVFIVRDRNTDENWRFGFAEFHSVEDSQAALARFEALDKFTIASKPVLVSYIHAGVFVPASSSDPQSFTVTNNPSVRLGYWDQKAYLKEFMVADQPPEGYRVTEAPAPSVAESKEDTKSKKRKIETTPTASNKKSVPSHLQFWKNRQAELHGNKPNPDSKSGQNDENSPMQTVQSYGDMHKKCCYLCFRQFKTEAEVNKHERLSQLHRNNLKNEQAMARADHKLKKAGIEPRMILLPMDEIDEPSNEAMDTPEYRDRAKERRQAYGQPNKPKVQLKSWNSTSTNKPEAEEENKPKGPSKGASLLGKMGWTEGQGLGAQGTGTVAPIATDVYAQGVGLGAQGGKLGDAAEEADKRTKGGYEAFVERAKEGARERWESMKE